MTFKWKNLKALSLLCIAVSLLSSSIPSSATCNRSWWFNPMITATGGIAGARIINSDTFTVNQSIYQYHSRGISDQAIWGGFIGTEIPLNAWALDLGVSYYQPSSFTANGSLIQGPDAESSDQYLYNFKIKTRQVLAEGKLLWKCPGYVFPYLSAGIGAAFNNAYAYNANFPRFLTFSPLFNSHSQSSFSYSVGAGVDMPIQKWMRFGLGYRFSDFGKAKLGAGVIDVVPITQTLHVSHIYTSEAVAQLTFLIV